MPLDKDTEEALHLHNEARAEIREDPRPPLAWSKTLTSDATAYAKKLASRNSGLKHSSESERTRNGEVCGEDLRMGYKGEKIGVTGRDSLWAHYTEIIWPQVTKIGIGVAKSRSGAMYIIVARYDSVQIVCKTPYNERKGNIFKDIPVEVGAGDSSRVRAADSH
ncbi:uncharacterized protein PAC_19008 [Phialocephala subalpina]|uniref:SCP domain-containing protein n=1 Tax=Phialocephala subalpina TaxID=576137 RepID=A0A1L7XVR9_9HELO|nr:uncharacterized protein PAC_19008 [Phialocephala subalpina]